MSLKGKNKQLGWNSVVGFMQISETLLPKARNIYVMIADGECGIRINGQEVCRGDYLIVAGSRKVAKHGRFYLCNIEGNVIVRKFIEGKLDNYLVKEERPPIVLGKRKLITNGEVVDVICKKDYS